MAQVQISCQICGRTFLLRAPRSTDVLHMLKFKIVLMLQVGPSLPLPGADSLPNLQDRLRGHLDQFTDAPFTLQRLCELLLEPHKQYARLHKLVSHRCADAGSGVAVRRKACPLNLGSHSEPNLKSIEPRLRPMGGGGNGRPKGGGGRRSRQRGGLGL